MFDFFDVCLLNHASLFTDILDYYYSIRLCTNLWLCLDNFRFKVDFWNSKVEFSVDFYYTDIFLMWFFYCISDLFYYNIQTIILIF